MFHFLRIKHKYLKNTKAYKKDVFLSKFNNLWLLKYIISINCRVSVLSQKMVLYKFFIHWTGQVKSEETTSKWLASSNPPLQQNPFQSNFEARLHKIERLNSKYTFKC